MEAPEGVLLGRREEWWCVAAAPTNDVCGGGGHGAGRVVEVRQHRGDDGAGGATIDGEAEGQFRCSGVGGLAREAVMEGERPYGVAASQACSVGSGGGDLWHGEWRRGGGAVPDGLPWLWTGCTEP